MLSGVEYWLWFSWYLDLDFWLEFVLCEQAIWHGKYVTNWWQIVHYPKVITITILN